MPNLGGIVQQLKTQRDRAQKEVERLNAALVALGSLGSQSGRLRRDVKSRKPLSVAARRRTAAAQRARWAKWKAAMAQQVSSDRFFHNSIHRYFVFTSKIALTQITQLFSLSHVDG